MILIFFFRVECVIFCDNVGILPLGRGCILAHEVIVMELVSHLGFVLVRE
jgi:hypothetical protein